MLLIKNVFNSGWDLATHKLGNPPKPGFQHKPLGYLKLKKPIDNLPPRRPNLPASPRSFGELPPELLLQTAGSLDSASILNLQLVEKCLVDPLWDVAQEARVGSMLMAGDFGALRGLCKHLLDAHQTRAGFSQAYQDAKLNQLLDEFARLIASHFVWPRRGEQTNVFFDQVLAAPELTKRWLPMVASQVAALPGSVAGDARNPMVALLSCMAPRGPRTVARLTDELLRHDLSPVLDPASLYTVASQPWSVAAAAELNRFIDQIPQRSEAFQLVARQGSRHFIENGVPKSSEVSTLTRQSFEDKSMRVWLKTPLRRAP
jgi:hypothetical protein